MDLSWTDPDDDSITGYQFRQKDGSSAWGEWTAISDSDDETTSHRVTGLDNNSLYRFQIRAQNSGGNSPASNTVSATPQQETAISLVPTDPSVTISTTSLTIDEGSTGSYTVKLDTAPSGPVTVTVGGVSGDVTVTGSPLTFTTLNYSTPQTVTVNAAADPDTASDPDVTLTHTASGGGYGSLAIDSVTVRVTDLTPLLQLRTDPPPVREGNPITLRVTSDKTLSGNLPVRLTLAPRGSSTFDADDIPGSLGPRDFSANFGTSGFIGTITIPTSTDALTEGAEDYQITLQDRAGYVAGTDKTANGTLNDAGPPGSGGGATPTTPSTPKPAAPTGFSARAGDGQVSLSWTDPSDASITRYELRYGKSSERSSATWAAISSSAATTVSHMVSSLENGEEYSFQLRAVNTSGNGAATDWVTATPSAAVVLPELQLSDPADVPEGQAIQLTVTSNRSLTGTLSVNLTLSAGSRGSFTAGDIVGTLGPRDFSADFGSSGSTTGTVTIPTTADSEDEGDEDYQITLNAKAGTYTLGSNITADGTIGEQATPLQPTWPNSGGGSGGATAGAGSVTLTWNNPTPGDASVKWQIRYGPRSEHDNGNLLAASWTWETITPTTASALFELEGMGLLPGTLLAAITPSQLNHALAELGFVRGDWIAQSSATGAVIRHTVRGELDSTVNYCFQVRGINRDDDPGPASRCAYATPLPGTASSGSGGGGGSSTTTPSTGTPVFQLSSDPADVSEGEAITLELTSSSPLTGTHAVSLTFSDRNSSGFTASDIPGGLGPRLFNAAFGSSPSRSGTITIPTSSDSAVEGREHYRITLNAATGYSLGSTTTADGTLLDPVPAKPTGLTATPGQGQVTLNWDDPQDASITGWQVQYKEGDGSYGNWEDIPNSTATTTSHTVTGLKDGIRYEFRLRAVNAVGAGDASDPVAATPLHPDAARAAKARKAALTGLSRATLSSATDVIGGRISGELNTTPSSDGSIGEQALGIVEDLLGISDTALPSSLSMEGIGEQLWHQTFQLSPPAATASATADGQRAQADDTTAEQQRNWALWGAGDLRLFNGDDAQEQISYEGNLKTAWVGIDQQFSSPWRAGVAAAFSLGESDYTYERTSGETAGGSIKSRLTAFYPYGAVQLNERLRLWGTAGVGFGELRHQESSNDTDTQQQEQEQQGDLRMQLALVGFEQQLSSIGTWDFSLAGDLGLINANYG